MLAQSPAIQKRLDDLGAIYTATQALIRHGVSVVCAIFTGGIPIVEVDLFSIPRFLSDVVDVGSIDKGGVVFRRYLAEYKGVYVNFQVKEVK